MLTLPDELKWLYGKEILVSVFVLLILAVIYDSLKNIINYVRGKE